MSAPRRDPYRDEILRRTAARAPLGFTIFLVCLALSALFEILRFPERRVWMAALAAGFVALIGIGWGLVARRPAWSVGIMVIFVNVVGVALNAYHVIVSASVAMCVWQLTALVATSAVVLPWGSRNQALACIGILASYPLHLVAMTADPLIWGAGGTYLLVVTSLSVFAASLFAGQLRRDLQFSATLSEREARLQSYFDLALVGTAVLTSDAAFGEVNGELCLMFGYSRAELLRLSWAALVHPTARTAAASLLERTLAGGGAPARAELSCVRRDGSTMDAMVSVRGLPGPHGAIDHVMVLVQDVTERRRAEVERERHLAEVEAARLQAEEASRAKDTFLATVSHELRTPLAPILAWSTLLRQRDVGEKSDAAIAAIERNARVQSQLIDDLLDVSRIVTGKWRLTICPVDLVTVVRAAVEVMQPAADAKGVELRATLPARAVSLRGDPDRLEQVFTNLLSNAVKFTPRDGRVEVELACVGRRARVTVRDTGEGIRAEFLPRVFERFQQADSSTTRRHPGLGLGLAIVKALVERHGGTVRAESPGEERGAVFTVELPLVVDVAAATGAENSQDTAPLASLGGLHVLVVDDNPDSNAAVSALLAACGAEVRTAESTPEALEIAGLWPPDVLVSDIAMPGADGYALLRELRARGGHLGRLPAIALSARGAAADRLRSLDAGFLAHIAKPFNAAELTAAVESAAGGERNPSV